jgi:hypothetical protein
MMFSRVGTWMPCLQATLLFSEYEPLQTPCRQQAGRRRQYTAKTVGLFTRHRHGTPDEASESPMQARLFTAFSHVNLYFFQFFSCIAPKKTIQ